MNQNELYEAIFQTRSVAVVGEVTTRAAVILPESLDDTSRSVRCTLTTEDAVPVYDWNSGRVVLETLVVAGCVFDDQTPLLRDHMQYSVDAILGSITEVAVVRDTLDGLVTFGDELDDASEAIWRRVKQGHLRRVSVGYMYTRDDYATVPAGESQDIGGRTFTAPKERDLRVVFRWELREVSVVVIPADKRAQMRAANDSQTNTQRGTPLSDSQNSEGSTNQLPPARNERNQVGLIQFLIRCGMSAAITDQAEAIQWSRGVAPHLHAEVTEHARSAGVTLPANHFTNPTAPVEAQRSAPPIVVMPVAPAVDTAPAADPAIAERSRQSAIRSLHSQFPSVTTEVFERCLNDGLTVEASRSAFLESFRAAAQPPVAGTAPAAHVHGGMTLRTLQAGLMLKLGMDPDSAFLRAPAAESVMGRTGMDMGWLRGASRQGEARNTVEQAFDAARASQLQSGSMMRFAEGLIELGGQRAPWNQDELLERAFSSGNFTALFGSVVHMMMVAGYQSTANTYTQIARVIDVPDFRPTQEAMAGGVGRLKKQGKNGNKAALLNIDSPLISQVAAERYAGLLKLTDQVFIQDSFGALNVLPSEVGISAASIPNDLVYSIVLGNPNMSDGQAFYINGQNRIADGSLDEAGLAQAAIMLANKTVNGKRIVVNNGVLLHGTTLSVQARKILNNTTSGGGDGNVMLNAYRRLEDNVVDLGCINPAVDPEAVIAGKPASYFLFADPLRSLTVAFRQGTNRGPVTRSTALSEGEWGFAWDVYIDCGATASTRIGTVEVAQA